MKFRPDADLRRLVATLHADDEAGSHQAAQTISHALDDHAALVAHY